MRSRARRVNLREGTAATLSPDPQPIVRTYCHIADVTGEKLDRVVLGAGYRILQRHR